MKPISVEVNMARVVLAAKNRGRIRLSRAMRAYLVHAAEGYAAKITRNDLVNLLFDLGNTTLKGAYNDINELLREHKADDGTVFRFAYLHDGIIVRLGLDAFLRQFGVQTRRRLVALSNEDLGNPKLFDTVLYRIVLEESNECDGVTLSRAGKQKLTGKSEKAQKRAEKKTGIINRKNYASIARAKEDRTTEREVLSEYPKRCHKDFPGLVQIRNSALIPGAEDRTYQVSSERKQRDPRTKNAKHANRFRPDEFYARQKVTRKGGYTLQDIKALLETGVSVDLYVGEMVNEHGELFGYYVRLVSGSRYSNEELQYIFDEWREDSRSLLLDNQLVPGAKPRRIKGRIM